MRLNPTKWFRKDPQMEAARRLYVAIVEQARQPNFYTICGVPDTVTGRFDLIALHCFLVMNRLKDGNTTRPLAQAISDVVVDDMDRNLREMGTGDLAVGKKVKRVMEGYFGRLEGYKQALSGDDVGLAAALRRNLFAEATPSDGQLAAVVGYMRREAAGLGDQPIDRLEAGYAAFGPPPSDDELEESHAG
jgi:cytochrome b pre-mRNA-processing protein 3